MRGAEIYNLAICDHHGMIYRRCNDGMNSGKKMAKLTNPDHITGTLADAMKSADVFVCVSVLGLLQKKWLDQ